MSQDPHDDEELEAFLSRDSELSRRYRQSGDEQPPAHVDAAILAASRWAVGADRTSADRTSSDRPGADSIGVDKTGADRDGRGSHYAHSSRTGARWRRSSVVRWSVPLAMAAVVVVAVTLTITMERDPELDRIYQRYDIATVAESEAPRERAAADVELTPAPAAKSVAPGVTARPGEPAPALPLAKQEPTTSLPPATLSSQAKEQTAREPVQQQPAQQDRIAARKRSEAPQQGLATDQSIKRDAPATLADEQVRQQVRQQAGQRVVPAPMTAEPFPDAISSETKAADQSDADVSTLDQIASREDASNFDETTSSDETASPDEARDESAVASTLTEPEEAPSAAVMAPGRQQAVVPPPLGVPRSEQDIAEQELDDREIAESVQPAEIATAEALREPSRWIEDIEELLAQGRRTEAIDSLKEFRVEYPDYELPPDLEALLPASGE